MSQAQTTTTHVYKVADGCQIHLDVHTVPSAASRPAILWLHGGGLILGSRRMLPAAQAQRYLEAGFTVIAADYRLAPEVKIPAIVADVIDAFHWIRNHGQRVGVDPARIAVVGHSAGGYLSLSVAARVEPPPKAVVSFYGYGDISGEWAAQPSAFYRQSGLISANRALRGIGAGVISHSSVESRLDYYLYCRQQGTWRQEIVGADYDDAGILIREYGPAYAISPRFPPTLLLHGDQDADVPVSETDFLAERLAQAQVPHKKIILPGYGHGFDLAGRGLHDPEVARSFAVAVGFLKRYV